MRRCGLCEGSVEACTYLLLRCWSATVVLLLLGRAMHVGLASPHGCWILPLFCWPALGNHHRLRAQQAGAAAF